jgi:hypothetical protein
MSFFGKVGYPNDFSSLPVKDVSHGDQPRPTTEIGKVFHGALFTMSQGAQGKYNAFSLHHLAALFEFLLAAAWAQFIAPDF